MSPPSALHRSGGCAPALSPHLKIFLSGGVLFFGAVGALPFYQMNQAQSLPVSSSQNVATAIPQEVAAPFPNGEPKDGVPMVGTTFDQVPAAIAVQSEKYAKAYPEPTLVSETSSSVSARPPTGSPSSPPAPLREFTSIHQLVPGAAPPLNRQAVTFNEQPECIDPSKLADSLLPMFHFAENLKSLSTRTIDTVPPENPFLPSDIHEDRKLSPLRPYVELRPLRLPEKK